MRHYDCVSAPTHCDKLSQPLCRDEYQQWQSQQAQQGLHTDDAGHQWCIAFQNFGQNIRGRSRG